MSEVINSVQPVTEPGSCTNERKKLTRKLFAAYINEQLISSNPVNNNFRKNGNAINTFDSTDLFYLLSLAEKLPVYGVGFSGDEVH